jgi:hypothetical protein
MIEYLENLGDIRIRAGGYLHIVRDDGRGMTDERCLNVVGSGSGTAGLVY